MEIKNRYAEWFRLWTATLFPIRRKWRLWLSYIGPVPLAVAWPHIIEPNVLNLLLVGTFYLFVVYAFTKWMVRDQFKADVRLEVNKLESDYAEIIWMIQQLPPEERRQYDGRAKAFALRLLTLNKLLAELEK